MYLLYIVLGGNYTPQMKKDETNVLILIKPVGQKFTYAQNWGLLCVNPSWVYESVEKGYMVDIQNYVVKNKMLSSTPAASNQRIFHKISKLICWYFPYPSVLILAEFSQNDLSEIVAEPKSTIEETMKNQSMLKHQNISNCKLQDINTTPKKNNGQC